MVSFLRNLAIKDLQDKYSELHQHNAWKKDVREKKRTVQVNPVSCISTEFTLKSLSSESLINKMKLMPRKEKGEDSTTQIKHLQYLQNVGLVKEQVEKECLCLSS